MSSKQFTQYDFNGLGIAPVLLRRIQELGFAHPTPIQHKAIPIATSGEDVVGIAQTGSGKTLAFSIPMLQFTVPSKQTGLVLLPTRELAVQVDEAIRDLGKSMGLRTALIIGGTNPRPQVRQLRARPHIIIATPGRLIDHIQQKNVSFSTMGMVVLDEADRMLDMGFAPQLKKILSFLPKERQTMLFSATMPDEIVVMARKYMKKPLHIEVAKHGTTADSIDQEVIIVPRSEKLQLLERLLKEHRGSVLVFSRTKYGAAKIARRIRRMGYTADEIHSNRSQNQRQRALRGFSNGHYRVLVATDIAARGIDIDQLELVVNYDLPDQIEDYVHRIGRTGRAGRSGKAISFASPTQREDVKKIERLINLTLPISSHNGQRFETQSVSKGRSRHHRNSDRRHGSHRRNRRNTAGQNHRRRRA